jgi:hypothetical protein
MLLMDRENLLVPGYSHVLSSGNDIGELEEFRLRVGAPPRALHFRDGRPHLDLKLHPRQLALTDPAVRVFETTRELIRNWRRCRDDHPEVEQGHPGTDSRTPGSGGDPR